MKCDELKQEENPIEWGLYYDNIAELKAENERLSNALDKEHSETIKYMDELCNAKNEIERLTIGKRDVELRADIADATLLRAIARKARRCPCGWNPMCCDTLTRTASRCRQCTPMEE